MFIKLSTELIKELSIENEVISWTELKEKLLRTDELSNSEVIRLLESSKFMAKLPEIQIEKTVTAEEYAQLISSSSTTPTKEITTEITQLRSDFAELRRETTWLLNCFFSVIGTTVFVYFVVSFYFDKVESRIVCSIVTGLVLFFIEDKKGNKSLADFHSKVIHTTLDERLKTLRHEKLVNMLIIIESA